VQSVDAVVSQVEQCEDLIPGLTDFYVSVAGTAKILKAVSDASFVDSILQLTSNSSSAAGAIWNSAEVPFKEGFAVDFEYRMKDPACVTPCTTQVTQCGPVDMPCNCVSQTSNGVTYGESFVLKHTNTGLYLTAQSDGSLNLLSRAAGANEMFLWLGRKRKHVVRSRKKAKPLRNLFDSTKNVSRRTLLKW
jgi:hypothetical protein